MRASRPHFSATLVAGLVLNRIAKGCLVDGRVDIVLFATAVGEKADGLFLAYLRGVLWDATRVLIALAIMGVWAFVLVAAAVSRLF